MIPWHAGFARWSPGGGNWTTNRQIAANLLVNLSILGASARSRRWEKRSDGAVICSLVWTQQAFVQAWPSSGSVNSRITRR